MVKTAKSNKLSPTKVIKSVRSPTKSLSGKKVGLYNLKAEKIKEITLPASFFEAKINDDLIAQAIKIYLQTTSVPPTQSLNIGVKLPVLPKNVCPKGTGQARHSTAKAPQFVGGGSAHGPRGNQKHRCVYLKNYVKPL